jgi:hypothetical protein
MERSAYKDDGVTCWTKNTCIIVASVAPLMLVEAMGSIRYGFYLYPRYHTSHRHSYCLVLLGSFSMLEYRGCEGHGRSVVACHPSPRATLVPNNNDIHNSAAPVAFIPQALTSLTNLDTRQEMAFVEQLLQGKV